MVNQVSAVLFDLDDTLVPTKGLENARKTKNIEELREKLPEVQPFKNVVRLLNELAATNVKLGIVTNAPRWYAEELLAHFKFDFFDVVVAYDDVGPFDIKPSPKGILLALSKLGITDTESVIYIGDQESDVNAAYAAGVIPFGPAWVKTIISQMPACVVSTKTLLANLSTPQNIRLLAEAAADKENLYMEKGKEFYFSPINLDGNVVMPGRQNIEVLTFGRYFSNKSLITAELHANHKLSLDIARKDHVENFEVPEYWVDLFVFALERLSAFIYRGEADFDIITVIPSKKEKHPRLENLLERIKQKGNFNYQFIPDIFEFSPRAPSLKTLGGREARDAAVSENLNINPQHLSYIAGKVVVVIDDVITTGATFARASNLLSQQNVKRMLGICIAKTVHAFGEQKVCEKCNRVMRAKLNGATGIKFWGCSGYYETTNKCTHTSPIEIKECPHCGKSLFKQQGEHGYYLSHDWKLQGRACKHTEKVKN